MTGAWIPKSPSTLRLYLDCDNELLTVEVESDGWAGRTTSCIGGDLSRFAGELHAYPILREAPPTIQGGGWKRDGTFQEDVYLRVAPANSRGTVGILIRVSAHPEEYGSRDESRRSLRLELYTDYNTLDAFASDLEALAAGTRDEVVLSTQLLSPG